MEGRSEYDRFIGEVQSRGYMASHEEASRATLRTLVGREPHNLADQLPPELAQKVKSLLDQR